MHSSDDTRRSFIRPLVMLWAFALLLALSGCGAAADGAESAPASSDRSGSSGATSGASESGDSSSESGDREGEELEEPGQLTAGAWRDLSNWEFWTDLFHRKEEQSEEESDEQEEYDTYRDWTNFEEDWEMLTRWRYAVRVVSGERPVVDATVELRDGEGEKLWSARTDNRGRAELFRGFFGGETSEDVAIVVRSGGEKVIVNDVEATGATRVRVQVDEASSPSPKVDVMFMVDTTGSMGDELSYIHSELAYVIEESEKQIGEGVSMRTSVGLYRDTEDEYVVKSHPFREDVSKAVSDLRSEEAAGGGDVPEAVDRALETAIQERDWSEEARARLLFLVLDAPPHNNEKARARLESAIRTAAAKGIRIIPVTGSGAPPETEFLMRSYDIATGGTYVFLTDHSGIGDDHLEPSVGDYDVRYLNELLVDLVESYGQPVAEVSESTR